MSNSIINNFDDFLSDLRNVGMTTGGANNEGVFTLCDSFSDNIKWHTEDMDTDPWEWRMRVLDECNDIAYSKLFFKKSGFITKEWYPYFYAVRRNGISFEEAYEAGTISSYAKRIYDLICENEVLPLHVIKQLGGFTKEDKSKFDSAVTELQMRMFITMCGRSNKISSKGQEYGWSSTVFCPVEKFFEADVFAKADKLIRDEAYQELEKHIYKLNPYAISKKVKKFIEG